MRCRQDQTTPRLFVERSGKVIRWRQKIPILVRGGRARLGWDVQQPQDFEPPTQGHSRMDTVKLGAREIDTRPTSTQEHLPQID